jgi:3-phosphoshikimate 1-carboxyvinyltransferase
MSAVRPVKPVRRPLDAVISVPGSKSMTNRTLVAAALADGVSTLDGILLADDTYAMIDGLGGFGVTIAVDEPRQRAIVHGHGGVLAPGPLTVDCRLAGTVSRFLTAVAAIGPGPYTIDAAPSMRSRPMSPLVIALRSLGARIDGDRLPLVVAGGGVAGGAVALPGDVSSQFLSALLLTAPYFAEGLTVELTTELVSQPYVEMTAATMATFGVDVARRDGRHFAVPPTRYMPAEVTIEPDATAASYFWAAAAICGGRVRVRGLDRDSGQGDVRFADVLAAMGATAVHGGDGIEISVDGPLRGITVDMADISDTVPTLAAVAAFADGATRITGVGFIRRKESDRIGALVHELRRCGVAASEEPDGLLIHGLPTDGSQPHGARIETYDDHRMAMSFALLGLRVPGIAIADPDCVTKTFPEYFDVLAALGPPAGDE